jgi:hypothetical protein
MELLIESLIAEHREIEAALEVMAEGIGSASIDIEAFRNVYRMCRRHYEREEEFYLRLAARDQGLAAKLRGQHAEALELAGCIEEAALAGQSRDSLYLARRFLAIVQHNIIEEERDVFPLFKIGWRSRCPA